MRREDRMVVFNGVPRSSPCLADVPRHTENVVASASNSGKFQAIRIMAMIISLLRSRHLKGCQINRRFPAPATPASEPTGLYLLLNYQLIELMRVGVELVSIAFFEV